ncbi:hypothetical protein CLOP_g5872 [Closterium sp. NIES-67]|nr:hypothetical protein CLOP_g5872 [Closterium sp. NIES-67]
MSLDGSSYARAAPAPSSSSPIVFTPAQQQIQFLQQQQAQQEFQQQPQYQQQQQPQQFQQQSQYQQQQQQIPQQHIAFNGPVF